MKIGPHEFCCKFEVPQGTMVTPPTDYFSAVRAWQILTRQGVPAIVVPSMRSDRQKWAAAIAADNLLTAEAAAASQDPASCPCCEIQSCEPTDLQVTYEPASFACGEEVIASGSQYHVLVELLGRSSPGLLYAVLGVAIGLLAGRAWRKVWRWLYIGTVG